MSVFIATVFGAACTRPAASRQQAATSTSAALHAMLACQPMNKQCKLLCVNVTLMDLARMN
jgi:hypothetical protein